MRERVKDRTPRDPRRGEKCRTCKEPAFLIGWHYAPARKFWKSKSRRAWRTEHMRKAYEPMCKAHFLEFFFGIITFKCRCWRKAQRLNAFRLSPEDVWSYVPDTWYYGEKASCARHHTPAITIRCPYCGRVFQDSRRTSVNRKNPCWCGRSGDAIDHKEYWKLEYEERLSFDASNF